jgi:hypothetical protein
MFVRMVFSSLVDADFIRTEAFMSPDKTALRPSWAEVLEGVSAFDRLPCGSAIWKGARCL